MGLISWLLKNRLPASLLHQIQGYHWTELKIKNVWPHLLECYNTHGCWPTLGEAQAVLQARMGQDPMRFMYCEFLKTCYQAESTGYSGEAIKQWVTARELSNVGSELGTLSQKPYLDQLKQLQDLQYRLDTLTTLDELEETDDEFDPLSDEWLEEVDNMVEEEYGAMPLPLGIPSLDWKIKGGGVRPHGVLVVGPTGGGKSTLAVNIAAHCLRLGGRVIYLAFDDSAAEITERFYAHMLRTPVDFEAFRAAGTLPDVKRKLKELRESTYVGHLIIKKLEPETHTPTDIIRMLEEIQTKCRVSDLAAGAEEDDAGVIDLIIGDTADQIRPDRHYKDSWYEVGKTHQKLCTIPDRFNCPWLATIQGGQQTVGAAQITERDAGEGYAKNKPYKLILGVAQTHAQYHSEQTVNIADTYVQQNLGNMTNYSYPQDKDTTWRPFSLCLIKNTRAATRKGHFSNKVKIPMLVSYGTQRMIVDYSQAESPLTTSMQTHREDLMVKEAQKAPPVRRGKVEKL